MRQKPHFWKELRKERKELGQTCIDMGFYAPVLENRKKFVAIASRREGACNRAGELSVTFCGEEEQRSGRLIFTK